MVKRGWGEEPNSEKIVNKIWWSFRPATEGCPATSMELCNKDGWLKDGGEKKVKKPGVRHVGEAGHVSTSWSVMNDTYVLLVTVFMSSQG